MKPKVVRGPVSDAGDIMRLVEENGRVWAEIWQGPERGWVRGIVDVGTVMSAHAYPSRRLLEAQEVPHDDWPAHLISEAGSVKPKVVRGPVSDGTDIMRLVEEDGWVWAELWQGPERGWVREIIEVGTVMSAHDTSRRLLEALGVPRDDWPDDVD